MKSPKLAFKILVSTLILVCAALIWLTEPYLEKKIVRASGPERILVEYVSYACGDTCPRLTEVIQNQNGQENLAQDPFYLSLPPDIQNPEESIGAVNGNRFILHGFRNNLLIRNKITQKTEQKNINRLEVYGWEIIVPYKVWANDPPETVMQNKPLKYFSKLKSENINNSNALSQ